MSKEPRVRDFTDNRSPLQVDVVASPFFDMLAAIWAIGSDEELEGYELGREWFENLQKALNRGLRKELLELTGPTGALWFGLFGLVGSAPKPYDIDSLLTWLTEVDADDILTSLLGCCTDVDQEAAVLARTGSGKELDGVLSFVSDPNERQHLRRLLASNQDELPVRVAAALSRFREDVFRPFEEDFGPKLARDARATRVLAKDLAPSELIETVTNGLVYRPGSGVRRLVLIPSVVMRPWCLIAEHKGTLVVSYPIADENLAATGDEAPAWLVKVLKALADERRLRILHRLAEGEASLDELTEVLGAAKSTVHHHVAQLRGAGLVRVVAFASSDTRYALRPAIYPEIGEYLVEYLSPTLKAALTDQRKSS